MVDWVLNTPLELVVVEYTSGTCCGRLIFSEPITRKRLIVSVGQLT